MFAFQPLAFQGNAFQSDPWLRVEDALHAWTVRGSGLPVDHVMWSQQQNARPAGTFITLRAAVHQRGLDWVDVTDAGVPAPGAEVEYRSRGVREVCLSLQCFGGGLSTVGYLERVRSRSGLPSERAALSGVNVAVLRFGSVEWVDGYIDGRPVFEPRACMDVYLHSVSEVTELGTFIEAVRVESDEPDTSTLITEP